jgi:hypothetical protein
MNTNTRNFLQAGIFYVLAGVFVALIFQLPVRSLSSAVSFELFWVFFITAFLLSVLGIRASYMAVGSSTNTIRKIFGYFLLALGLAVFATHIFYIFILIGFSRG